MLIRMLRYQGELSNSQLENAMRLADRYPSYGQFVDELLARGIISEHWANRARHYLKRRSRSNWSKPEELGKIDRSFGQIALAKGWVAVAELELALLEQERLRRRNLYFRIGEVLLKNRKLNLNQVRDILREQGLNNFHCLKCDLVIKESEEKKCPSCGEVLVEAEFLDIVHADLISS